MEDGLSVDTVVTVAVSAAIFFVVWEGLLALTAYLETTPEGQAVPRFQ